MQNNKVVEQLNSFLRGEISAVETYRQALQQLKNTKARSQLEEVRMSHERRVELLRAQIKRLGGKPANGAGPWGTFAKLVEGGASMLGEKAAISALEEGEDHGLRDYRADLSTLDPESRSLVQRELMPAQERTHTAISQLKHTLH